VKVIPIQLATHYGQETTTLCVCLKVTRRDLQVFGFTSLNRAIEIGGLTYQPGFDVSSLASSESLAVDNLELTSCPRKISSRACGTTPPSRCSG
jgi:hypothetical protein